MSAPDHEGAAASAQAACHRQPDHGACHATKGRPDFLLWGSLSAIVVLYLHYGWWPESAHFAAWYQILASSVYELINIMWWSMAIGILMVALLSRIPREFVMSILGARSGLKRHYARDRGRCVAGSVQSRAVDGRRQAL